MVPERLPTSVQSGLSFLFIREVPLTGAVAHRVGRGGGKEQDLLISSTNFVEFPPFPSTDCSFLGGFLAGLNTLMFESVHTGLPFFIGFCEVLSIVSAASFMQLI